MTEELVLLPKVEALVSTWLGTQAEMLALLGGQDRIYTAIPGNPTYPLGRVNQYDEVKVTTRPLWVTKVSLQIEFWGGTKDQAFALANLAQALLDSRLEGTHSLGVVTGVEIGPLRDQPDTSFNPAKPRWLFSAYITAHP